MTGSKSYLNWDRSDYHSWVSQSIQQYEANAIWGPSSFSQDLLPKAVSDSRFTTRARPLLRRCVLVILLGIGLAYATCSMLAEYYYSVGKAGRDARENIAAFRHSAELFPLDRRFRTASALFLANLAVSRDNEQLKKIAIPEIKVALQTDPTQADLLAILITCELELKLDKDAQGHFEQFKRVAKKSPLIEMVSTAK